MARFSAKLFIKNTKPAASEEERQNLHLIKEECTGNLVSIDGYRLSCRVNSTEWSKIKHLMEYVNTKINDEIWHGSEYNGYIVKSGHEAEIEEILEVKPENRIATQQATRQKATAQKAEQETLIKECKKAFDSAKTPSPKGGLRVLTGETYGPGASSGGSGWWFVVSKVANRIWYVQNNGADGDNWNSNNVRTGGAGAVGCWLPYQTELAAKIEQIETPNVIPN